MEQGIDRERVRQFLAEVGRQIETPADLYLLGGCALHFLGSERPTGDLDYFGHDVDKNELQRLIDQVALEMRIAVEAVPLDEFIPISEEAGERHQLIGKFDSLAVYVFDPYSIAISKLDRGFKSDLDDIVFLVTCGAVDLTALGAAAMRTLKQGHGFDLDASAVGQNLETVRRRFSVP